MQNKCIRFCHKLDKMHHISEKEFRLISWLHNSKRVDQCKPSISNICPCYLSEIFKFAPHCRISKTNNFSKL